VCIAILAFVVAPTTDITKIAATIVPSWTAALIRIIPAVSGGPPRQGTARSRTGSKMTRFHGIAEMIVNGGGKLGHMRGRVGQFSAAFSDGLHG